MDRGDRIEALIREAIVLASEIAGKLYVDRLSFADGYLTMEIARQIEKLRSEEAKADLRG